MTLFVTEGLSRSGKTTTMERANLEGIPVTTNKGMDQVGRDGWSDYQWGVLEHVGQVYRQNPDITFIHDRLFTEAVYAEDQEQRSKFRRAAQSIPDVTVVYFEADKEDLEARGSKDLWRYDRLVGRYNALLESVDHKRIDTSELTIEESATRFENILMEDGYE